MLNAWISSFGMSDDSDKASEGWLEGEILERMRKDDNGDGVA